MKDIHYAKEVQKEHPGCDAVYYFNCPHSVGKAKEFKTLLVDLTRQPEEILRSFRKSTRIEIQKVMAEKKVRFDLIESPTEQELESYYHDYEEFAQNKKIVPPDWRLLYQLRAIDRLIIASASKENETLCRFVLINEEEKMICYYGYNARFSYIGDADKVKLISRANRALEYYCMLYARKSGKKYYDLCGLMLEENNPSAHNVDNYKMGFRGQMVTEYHFMQPITAKGKLFCWLKELRGGL